ncbi:MAG: hypothetical protein ACM3MK_03575 [Chitinophagales bacterium]
MSVKRRWSAKAAASTIGSSFKLSGDVGGEMDFFVDPGATRRLQVIGLSLPANSSLIVRRARFFFNDPEIFLRVSVLNIETTEIRHWLAPTSAGEVVPNIVLLNTTRARNIYVAIAGTNVRTTGSSLFRPDDGWWVKFSIVSRS